MLRAFRNDILRVLGSLRYKIATAEKIQILKVWSFSLDTPGLFSQGVADWPESQISTPAGRRTLDALLDAVHDGELPSEAMARPPGVFAPWEWRFVAAGEATGNPGESVRSLAMMLQARLDYISAIRSMAIYPVVLLTITIGVSLVYLMKVAPTLFSLLDRSGLPVAKSMKVLQGFAQWTLILGPPVVIVILAVLFLDSQSKDLPGWRLVRSRLLLNRFQVLSARILNARILAQGSRCGMPIAEALEAAATGNLNPWLAHDLGRIADLAASGFPPRRCGPVSPLDRAMIRFLVADQSDEKRAELLHSHARRLEQRLHNQICSLALGVEYTCIMGCGLLAGWAIIAFYSTLFAVR